MEEGHSIKLWGIVTDKQGNILQGVHIKLMKRVRKRTKDSYINVDNSITDEKGIYSFDIHENSPSKYKVIVLEIP